MEVVSVREVSFEDMDDLPKTVYKYRTWSDKYHKTILFEQKVFLSRPTSFEDPIDCKLFKRYDLLTQQQIYDKYLLSSKEDHATWTRQQHRKFARDWLKKSPMRDKEHIKKLQHEHFKEFDERFGVLSLTANASNFEMWDKYSEHHKGFCVGFNAAKMFQYLGGGGKVSYYDQLPDILPNDSYEEEHFKQVFSKERKWEFEQEYRTHKFHPHAATNDERQIRLPSDCFTEIIFGAEISDTHREEIIKVCEELNLKVKYFYEVVDYDKRTTLLKPAPVQT